MQNHDYDRDEAYESRLDALNATISERDARISELESLAEVASKEIQALRDWKHFATNTLNGWDDVWATLGKPGDLGSSKCVESVIEVKRLQARINELVENFKPLTQQYAAAFRNVGILIEREQYEEASLWKDRYEETMREIDSILKGSA